MKDKIEEAEYYEDNINVNDVFTYFLDISDACKYGHRFDKEMYIFKWR